MAGGIYALRFDSKADHLRHDEIGYSFSGFSNVTWVPITLDYAQSTGSFVATGKLTRVEFFLATDIESGAFYIDNVGLERTGTMVPEPGALALLGLGLSRPADYRPGSRAVRTRSIRPYSTPCWADM